MRSARMIKITTCALAGGFALFATSTAFAQETPPPDQQQPAPVIQQNNPPPVAQPAPQPAPQPVQQPVQQNTNVYPAQPAPAPQPVYQAPPPQPAQGNTVVEVHTGWDNGYYVREHEYRSAFLFDPGALISGVIDLEYEAALARWLGLALGVSVNTYKGAFEPKTQGSFVAFGPEIGLRAHFIQPAPAGLWIGPELAVKYVAWRDTSGTSAPSGATGTASADFAYELGASVGYNFTIDHFLLSLGAGGGFADYGSGVKWSPRFRLGVGAVF